MNYDADFEYSLSNISVKKALRTHGTIASDAIGAELHQMFKTKNVMTPVMYTNLSQIGRAHV